MKKLKLDNFKIASLSNAHMIKGGNGGDDDVETGVWVCLEKSSRWIKRPKEKEDDPDPIEQNEILVAPN